MTSTIESGATRGTQRDALKISHALSTHLIGLVIFSAIASLLGFVLGRHQYLGMDDSAAINAGWQLINGRVPYRDFLTGMPPFYLGILKLAFSFAPNYQSLLIGEVVISFVASLIIGLTALKLFRNEPHLSYLGVAVVFAINAPTGIPWYNGTSTTVILVTFCLTAVIWHQPTSRWLLLVPFAWMASLYSKGPTGIPAGILSIAIVFIALIWERRLRSLLAVVAGFVLISVLFTEWLGFSLGELIANYHDWSVRATSDFINWKTNNKTYVFAILVIFGMGAVSVGEFKRTFRQLRKTESSGDPAASVVADIDHEHSEKRAPQQSLWLIFIGIAFGIVDLIGLYENNELKTGILSTACFILWCSVPRARQMVRQFGFTHRLFIVIGIGVTLAIWWPLSNHVSTKLDVVYIAAFSLLLTVIIQFVLHLRSNPARMLRGWGLFMMSLGTIAILMIAVQYSIDRTPIQGQAFYQSSGPLTGFSSDQTLYSVEGGPKIHSVNSSLEQLGANHCTQEFVNPDDVFVGPRIDYGYAVNHWLPPVGLPIWWEAYTYAPTGMHYDPVQTFITAKPALAVFLYNDYTFIPLALDEYLVNNYQTARLGDLEVFGTPALISCYLGT